MSYLVLARKWRPQRFEDIAGQEHITLTLQNAIRADRVAHAYLFTGVRGVGKTTAARILAKALNCDKGPTPTPCDSCPNCSEIVAGHSIDVLEIDGASNRGIDEVRQIIENARYQPAQSRFKIYIIDEVHQVTKDAFNALLKTLEEPPPFVKFILATTEPHRLPETILSRCQRFDFRRIALREIVQRLSDIAKKEGLKITDGALVLLAREADGSMRDAQSLLEQALAYGTPDAGNKTESPLDERALHGVLGIAERRILYEISNATVRGEAGRCLELVGEVVDQGGDLVRLSAELVEHFRNLLVARLLRDSKRGEAGEKLQHPGPNRLLDLPDQEIADLSGQVAELSVDTLLDYFNFMAAGGEEVARSVNPRFSLESTLVRLATLPKTLPVAEVLERLEKLEKRLGGDRRASSASPKQETANAPSALAAVAAVEKEIEPDAARVWENFIGFVRKEKRFLASHLESGRLLGFTPDELKVGVAERHHLSYLQDAENILALKDLAKRFFSAEMGVSITALASDEPAGQRPEPGTGNEGDTMVKEALRIFGGSIKGARREN